MQRSRVRKSKDRRKFQRTANKTKAVNVNPIIMRGGYRI